jgi:hypothetical protein
MRSCQQMGENGDNDDAIIRPTRMAVISENIVLMPNQ